jgi:hypothetical protein
MTDDDSISIEFRKFNDLVRVCLRTYDIDEKDYEFLSESLYNDRFLYEHLDTTVKCLFTKVFQPMFDKSTEHVNIEYVSKKEFILDIDLIEYTEKIYSHNFLINYKMKYEELIKKIKGLEKAILV